jgi:hypothetical protein
MKKSQKKFKYPEHLKVDNAYHNKIYKQAKAEVRHEQEIVDEQQIKLLDLAIRRLLKVRDVLMEMKAGYKSTDLASTENSKPAFLK